jgi:hypothetical protein
MEERMCPACIASAAMVIGTVVSTGGITAVLARLVRSKRSEKGVEEGKAKENRS